MHSAEFKWDYLKVCFWCLVWYVQVEIRKLNKQYWASKIKENCTKKATSSWNLLSLSNVCQQSDNSYQLAIAWFIQFSMIYATLNTIRFQEQAPAFPTNNLALKKLLFESVGGLRCFIWLQSVIGQRCTCLHVFGKWYAPSAQFWPEWSTTQ